MHLFGSVASPWWIPKPPCPQVGKGVPLLLHPPAECTSWTPWAGNAAWQPHSGWWVWLPSAGCRTIHGSDSPRNQWLSDLCKMSMSSSERGQEMKGRISFVCCHPLVLPPPSRRRGVCRSPASPAPWLPHQHAGPAAAEGVFAGFVPSRLRPRWLWQSREGC